MTNEILTVREATEADSAAWDAYVEASSEGTFFHRFGWRQVIDRAYGYKGAYLMAMRGKQIVGVLPLIDVTSPLFGRNLISTAFTVGGGIAADSEEARSILALTAIEEGRRRRVGYVELRSQSGGLDGWQAKSGVYAGFDAPLLSDDVAALSVIPRRRRADIRKSLDAVASGELICDFDGDHRDFYALYAHAMRDHGTPVFPRAFLAELLREFGQCAEILIVRAKREPILALLSFYFRDRIMPYYIGGRSDARDQRAFDLALWRQMRRGAERGARMIDLGRSKVGSGAFNYKTYWGFEPKPLHYQYALIRARGLPNVNPDNPKFSAAVAAWRQLPLPIANLAGPLVARHIA